MAHYKGIRGGATALLVGLALSAASSIALAYETTLNIKDADINTLITTVSEVTGKNFIVDQRVKGKDTVISSSPMSADGVYETFLAVLQVYGFAVLPAGEAYKIVPEASVRTEGGTEFRSPRGLAREELVTRVLQIENVPAAQLVPILRPLVPQWGHLAAYAPSNMLIIADRANNVIRLERIIAQIDQSGDRDIQMIQLKHASAAEVVRVLTTLTQQDKQQDATSRPVTLIADERTNSVLIGGDRSDRQKLLDIVESLDVPTGEDGGTQVYYLRYASAENLAPILEGYAQQVDQAGGGAPQAQAKGGAQQSKILADKDTNALVITAPPKSMRQIRNVIEQLDVQRRQVIVETLIAEITNERTTQLGVNWAAFHPERIAATGILDPSTLSSVIGAIAAAESGTSVPSPPSGGTFALGRTSSDGSVFGALVNALSGDGDTNILSSPTLLTMDNEEAKFSVGREVPFLTGQFSNTGTTNNSVNPFQTIQRKDVGLTLGITPQINAGNVVKLKLDLENSSLIADPNNALNQTTNKRTITNTVAVENGQILVIGGLIDDQGNNSQQAIPFLSKIPLLGALFRSRSAKRTKSNLMVFLRPTILSNPDDGDYYTRRKYEYILDVQRRAANSEVRYPGGEPPQLPAWQRRPTEGPGSTPPEPLSGKPAAEPAATGNEDKAGADTAAGAD